MTNAQAEKPRLTLRSLIQTVEGIREKLNISTRCIDRSSAYADYVSYEFIVPRPTENDEKIIRYAFAALMEAHGWMEPIITVHAPRNSIFVMLQRTGLIDTSTDKRMPY